MVKLSRPSVQGTAAFCYVWLMLGFLTGTLVLLGPVRWLTDILRSRGYAETTENIAVVCVIVLYVATSALAARWLVRRTSRCGTRMRIAIPSALTVAAAICVWGWLNPAHLLGAAAIDDHDSIAANGAQFVFGPYPERERLEQLKREGFAGVVSLQHPAVLPFEPVGIRDEKQAAQEIGLEFIHAPMLPWISTNEESLEIVRDLAASGHGKYYVHCGLGRDRTNVVKRMLEREGAQVASGAGYMAPRTLEVTQDMAFERGNLRELEKDVWLLPYPNESEFFNKLLAGQVGHVTLALDPDDPTQGVWSEDATRLLTKYAVPFDILPLRGGDEAAARAVADMARRAAKPSAIIVGYTDPFPSLTAPAHTITTLFDANHAPSRTSTSAY
jgi:protein tyrosine phosphatase (PTP) superfamily phosphohydrolase (DUF442 family)